MKAIRLKIIDLLDQHSETSLYDCKGCEICQELEQLGKMFGHDPAKKERFKKILAKGADMTKKDIADLLEMEIDKSDIRKALGMNSYDFHQLMKNWGFNKPQKGEEELAKINLEEYNALKEQGLMDKEIAHRMNMAASQLSMMKRKWFEGSDKPMVNVEPTLKVLPPKEDKTSEMRQLIDELSDSNNMKDKRIKELESLLDNERRNHQAAHSAMDDMENEFSGMRELLEQERKAKEGTQQEYDRVQKALEESDYQLQNYKKYYESVQKSLEGYERENQALRALVKEWI